MVTVGGNCTRADKASVASRFMSRGLTFVLSLKLTEVEHLAQVWFPPPGSSGLHGYCTHVGHQHTNRQHTHNLKLLKLNTNFYFDLIITKNIAHYGK